MIVWHLREYVETHDNWEKATVCIIPITTGFIYGHFGNMGMFSNMSNLTLALTGLGKKKVLFFVVVVLDLPENGCSDVLTKPKDQDDFVVNIWRNRVAGKVHCAVNQRHHTPERW